VRVAALSTIETTDGVLVAERRDPAAAFAGTTRSSPWDEFQVAYFGSDRNRPETGNRLAEPLVSGLRAGC
jgi:hypothetical protein